MYMMYIGDENERGKEKEKDKGRKKQTSFNPLMILAD